jgi:hypothetical protein
LKIENEILFLVGHVLILMDGYEDHLLDFGREEDERIS